MNFDRWFTLATMAGLVGLAVLNPQGTTQIIAQAGKSLSDYVTTVQGR
jgi:hypothetical protein